MLKRLALLTALCMLPGCSGDEAKKPDGSVQAPDLDQGQRDQAQSDLPGPDLAPADLPAPDVGAPEQGPDFIGTWDAGPFTCNNDCHDYVISRVLLPTSTLTAQKYALVFKGKQYNALGNILALLAAQAPGMSVQASMDNAVCAGKTIDLLRVKAKSLASAAAVLGHSWVGADAKCCTLASCLDPYNQTQCVASAKTKCFSGSGAFKPDPSYPKMMMLPGSIANKQLSLGPGKLVLRLTLSSYGTMDLALAGAVISGTIDQNGVTSGVLAGGIPKAALNGSIMPSLTKMLDGIYKNPATDYSTVTMLKSLFDTNGDGTITLSELTNNALIKTFMAGDVDVDNDGVMELSMGIGFTAVKGKITP